MSYVLMLSYFLATAGALGEGRIAVVVGANEAPRGRQTLRFARKDAQESAAVLRDLGQFDEVILLEDPSPADVVDTLRHSVDHLSAFNGRSLLFFYYSGHADESALFPNGSRLPLSEIRTLMGDERVGLRVGVIDACRGGGWTGAKGLVEGEVFELVEAMWGKSIGSALIASSSGHEDAHESVGLQASFFTHHWNAGLRGAADRNQDERVTLAEAFEYSRARTVRDTAIHTPTPQHPSFAFQTQGREDMALTQLKTAKSSIVVPQSAYPIEVIHLDAGLTIVEIPPGTGMIRVAVSPGMYLLRSETEDGAMTQEVEVIANEETRVDEASLTLQGSTQMATKAIEIRGHERSTALKGTPVATTALGYHQGGRNEGDFGGLSLGTFIQTTMAYGITDRLEWSFPGALTYRFGRHRKLEGYVSGGSYSLSVDLGNFFGLSGMVGLRAGLRWWYRPKWGLDVGSALESRWGAELVEIGEGGAVPSTPNSFGPETWTHRTFFTFSRTFNDVITFSLGLDVSYHAIDGGVGLAFASQGYDYGLQIGMGSVGFRGARRVPLAQVHVSDRFNIDAHFSARVGILEMSVPSRITAMVGTTYTF